MSPACNSKFKIIAPTLSPAGWSAALHANTDGLLPLQNMTQIPHVWSEIVGSFPDGAQAFTYLLKIVKAASEPALKSVAVFYPLTTEMNESEVLGLYCIHASTIASPSPIRASRVVICAIRTGGLSLSQQRAVSSNCTSDSHRRKSNFPAVLSAGTGKVTTVLCWDPRPSMYWDPLDNARDKNRWMQDFLRYSQRFDADTHF